MFKKSFTLALLVLALIMGMSIGTVSVFAAGYLTVECEDYDDSNTDLNPHDSAQFIKAETTGKTNVGDIGNVGGTFDGGWILFEDVDFGKNGANKVTIQYCNHSGRCAPDAKVELRLGDEKGELIAEIPIPVTGENWQTYSTATANLKKVVTGKQDLCLVMRGTTTDSKKYIANFDFLEFTEAPAGAAPSPSASKEATPTPAETETPSEEPSQTVEATPEKTTAPVQSNTPAPSVAADPDDDTTKGGSPIVFLVIAIALVAVGVTVFIVLKNKNK